MIFGKLRSEKGQLIFKVEVMDEQRKLRSNCQHLLGHRKSKGIAKIYFCFIDYVKASDYVDQNKLWNILEEMGIPNHLTCLLRYLYASQETTVKNGHGTKDWFKIGKAERQACILLLCLFNLYAEYMMRNASLHEAQAGIKIAQIRRWHHPYGKKWKRIKEPLDESERGKWKSWLKTQHSEN